MKYDAALVLGRGVYEDGSIPASAKATIKKAVELYDSGKVGAVIFSGKWSYRVHYVPPITEAKAMADFAEERGLPREAIYLEEKSYTTVSNAYFIKKNILIPNNWKRLVLISVYPMAKRAKYVVDTVLGPEYFCDLITADFSFPPESIKEKEDSERERLDHAKEFYAKNSIKPGDHETIFKLTNEDLDKNWRK